MCYTAVCWETTLMTLVVNIRMMVKRQSLIWTTSINESYIR